jgi:hypothetical protein
VNAYDSLRQQAAAKRDKIIQNAKAEYRATMTRIRALHKIMQGEAMPGIRPPRRVKDRTLTDLMRAVLPKSEPFTVAEACEAVYSDPLGCKYKETSVRAQLRALQDAGELHKVGRRNGHVLWARVSAGVQVAAFGTMSLCEIAESLITERGPMRLAEIVVLMKERGHKPDEPAAVTHDQLRNAMKRVSGRFLRDDAGKYFPTTT